MMLKYLSYQELDQKIKSLAAREKQLLHEILLTIQEMDARKMYLDLGFSNLFSYLTTGVGYSEGAAQRRIDAARLLREIPEIGAKIQTGEIQLNQISLLQKTVRQVMKTQKQKVNTTQKKEILQQLSCLNHSQSQQKISEFFDLPILTEVKRQTQADASVRLEVTLSKELFQKIEQAQQLLSHQIPSGDLVQYLEYVTDQVIKHYTSTKVGKSNMILDSSLSKPDVSSIDTAAGAIDSTTSVSTATVAVLTAVQTMAAQTASRKIKPSDRKRILSEQNCCQYVDPRTGKKCQSRWFLQVDHRQPRWAEGSNQFENLQILCSAHNRHKYRNEASIQCVSR